VCGRARACVGYCLAREADGTRNLTLVLLFFSFPFVVKNGRSGFLSGCDARADNGTAGGWPGGYLPNNNALCLDIAVRAANTTYRSCPRTASTCKTRHRCRRSLLVCLRAYV